MGFGNNLVEDKECRYGVRLTRATIQLKIAGLKTLFREIAKQDPLFTDPFENMNDGLSQKLRDYGSSKRKSDFLDVEEMMNLIQWLRERAESTQDPIRKINNFRDYAIVFMLATSGLRASEFLQLRWKNIEFAHGKWLFYFKGKGDRKEESIQQLYAPALDACREYFRLRIGREPKKQNYFFYNIDDHGKLKYPNLRTILIEIGNEAFEKGVFKRQIRLRAHTFRRTFAKILYKSGMGLKEIQVLTRHRSVETLAKHYLEDEADSVPILDRIFGNSEV